MMERWKDTQSGRSLSIGPSYHRSIVSLAFPRKVEPHEQHLRRPCRGQRTKRAHTPRLLNGTQRLEIEPVVAGTGEQLQTGHCAVAMHEEHRLRFEGPALVRVPPLQHLRHEILQVLRKRERDAFGADGGDVVAGRGALPRQWLIR